MRVKQISKALALLMIYLIISITFFSASVFATIFKAEGMGQDQAPGVIRSTDNLVIKTESVMPCSVSGEFITSTINNTNNTTNTFMQMNCGSGTPMSCAYTKQVTNVTGTLGAVVMESGSEETKDIIVYVDSNPPTIISLATSSLGSKVKATYNIRDTASADYLDKCGGIKKVELLLNNQVVNTTNHTVGQCTVNSFLTGTIPNYIGKVNTSVRVQDYVGLNANATGTEVFIDSTPPKINAGAKTYYPGTTDEIKTISTNSTKERTADVMVIVSENALAQSGSVFGDFHLLDKTNTSTQSNVTATCTRPGWNETYECTFSGIKLMPSSASTPINIVATDQAGNTANQSLSLTFSIINTAGTVIRVGPEASRCIGSICYVKAGTNNITADISSSSSFNQSEVLIQGTKAECARVSNWQCRADAVIRTGATFIEVTGTDDLGNVLSGRGNITVDSTAPKKIGVLNSTPDCPTSKESLRIVVNVSEAQSPSLKIRAKTDSISTNNETIASCSKIDTASSNWQCILTVSNLKSEGINTNLAVIVEDFAGNQLVESVPVKICVEVNEIPELIEKIKTTGTLPRIDRKTVSKIVVKVPLSLQIVLKEPSVEITQRSTVTCAGTPGLSGQAYMIDETGLTPTLVVPLKCDAKDSCSEQWDEAGKILINCTQEFNIKQGNRIYTQRESESITAELEYYNQPLGSLDENFNKKIKEIKTDIQKLDKQIKKYDKVHKILGTICTLAEGIAKVNALLQTLKLALWFTCVALETVGIGEGIWNLVNPILSGVENFADSFVWPQGWVPKPGNHFGLLLKGGCAIYTCKIYDFNTYVDIAMSFAAHYATRNDITIKDKICSGKHCSTQYSDGSQEITNEDGTREFYSKDGSMTKYDANNNMIEEQSAKEVTGADGKTTIELTTKDYTSGTTTVQSGNSVTITNNAGKTIYKQTANSDGTTSITYFNDLTGKEETFNFDKDKNLITSTSSSSTVPEGIKLSFQSSNPFSMRYPGLSYQAPQDQKPSSYAEDYLKELEAQRKTSASLPADKTVMPPASSSTKTPAVPGYDKNGVFVGLTADQISALPRDQQLQILLDSPRTKVAQNFAQIGFGGIKYIFSKVFALPSGIKLLQDGKVINMVLKNGVWVAGGVVASDSITGNAFDPKNPLGSFKLSGSNTNSNMFDLDVRMQTALDAFLGSDGNWIYNPYKSKHYDSLCAPAILFNDRKERQLLCKRLGCLEEMAKIGGPLEACEFDYNLDMCMYVESARYKVEGGASIGKVLESAGRVFLNSIGGLSITMTYLFFFPCDPTSGKCGCIHYQTPGGLTLDYGGVFKGSRAAFCGVAGSWLSLKEVLAFAKNPYNPLSSKSTVPTDIPTESPDFCAEVNYNE